MEQHCDHIGFIIENKDSYSCLHCGDIAYKYMQKGITGIWADGEQPEEITKQYLFEKAFQIQKENELRKEF